ncbi:MAG: transposase [Hydrogenophilus sp.]|nr:transposase [Hydrogenophilus sp.]
MKIYTVQTLFPWEELEDNPSLDTIKRLFETVPDEDLIRALINWRGHGRNDYPVRVLWGVVLLTIFLRHTSFESCLAELRRNPHLRRLIGIEGEEGVPKKWNISRFLDVLGREPFLGMVRAIFDTMIRRLGGGSGRSWRELRW